MVDLDRFESEFRAAVKERPVFEPPDVKTVAVMTDLASDAATGFEAKAKSLLQALDDGDVAWTTVDRAALTSVKGMLEQVERIKPDLIVTHRHLLEEDRDLPHSLGTYVDMLVQAISTPVLLSPNPRRADFADRLRSRRHVMVLTDHIVGDQRLVNWGLRFVPPAGGALTMVHLEDDTVLRRYLDVISKIPDLDTQTAEQTIGRRLLHEAQDFLDAWARSIQVDHAGVMVESIVRFGHRSADYIHIAREARADLLVFNTRDEEQLAMHGVAYALAVELLDLPLLMI